MRGQRVVLIMSVWMVVALVSCATPATDDEITAMCGNLVQLRGEVSNPSVETLISDIEVRFDKEQKQLEESLLREQKALNEELQAKLEAAENDEDREALKTEYAAKLKDVSADHDPRIKAVTTEKKDAVASAQKKAEENRTAWDEAVDQCVTQAKSEGVSQKVARCRIGADSTDKYWNICR